ncbi:MAG: hypothetical protein ACOCQQ_03205 [Candidatus Nanoarchaeia archaeon]
MVQIIVDTQKDSSDVLQRVVALLQEELVKKNNFSSQQTSSSENGSSSPSTSANSFTSLFDDQPSQQSHTSQSPKSVESLPSSSSSSSSLYDSANPFDMFSNGLPSSSNVSSSQKTSRVPIADFSQESSLHPKESESSEALSDIDNLFTGKKNQPTDFEGSSRFSEYNAREEPKKEKKDSGFFNDLDVYE